MKEHAKEEMYMSVCRGDDVEAYATKVAKFARVVVARQYPNNWLEYYMLPQPHYTPPFQKRTKVWRYVT